MTDELFGSDEAVIAFDAAQIGRGEPQLAPFGALFELVNGRPSITRPLSLLAKPCSHSFHTKSELQLSPRSCQDRFGL